MEANLEDIIEMVALTVMTVGVICTAIYVEKIYRLLKDK
jgi:hypothetical protein